MILNEAGSLRLILSYQKSDWFSRFWYPKGAQLSLIIRKLGSRKLFVDFPSQKFGALAQFSSEHLLKVRIYNLLCNVILGLHILIMEKTSLSMFGFLTGVSRSISEGNLYSLKLIIIIHPCF